MKMTLKKFLVGGEIESELRHGTIQIDGWHGLLEQTEEAEWIDIARRLCGLFVWSPKIEQFVEMGGEDDDDDSQHFLFVKNDELKEIYDYMLAEVWPQEERMYGWPWC